MHVAVVQLDIAWEDKPRNQATFERMIDDARLEPGTLVVLPELGDTGFSFALDRIVDDATLPWACEAARRRGIWLQVGYAVRGDDGKGRNCASLVSPRGEVIGTYQKVHPFSYGREAEHFSGGRTLAVVPVGGAAVCPLICYDLRFPELWRLGAAAGAEIFTIGASWPNARQAHWRALVIARAIENQAYVVAVNRIGSDPNLSYDGGSLIVSPHGEVLAESAHVPAVLCAELDVDALRRWRAEFPALRDMRPELLGTVEVTSAIKDMTTGTPAK